MPTRSDPVHAKEAAGGPRRRARHPSEAGPQDGGDRRDERDEAVLQRRVLQRALVARRRRDATAATAGGGCLMFGLGETDTPPPKPIELVSDGRAYTQTFGCRVYGQGKKVENP